MIRQIGVLVVLILSLSACDSWYNNRTESNEQTPKIFRYNQHEGLSSLDPLQAKNQANIWVISQIFNGLFEFTEDLSINPCIAKSWSISDEGKLYIIDIRDDIYFHDSPAFRNGKGRLVTAYDFEYSFKRLLDPTTGSTGSWIFSDKLERDASGEYSDESIKAVDKFRLKIRLNKAIPSFLQILAMPYAFVVPEEAINYYGKDFARNPVGTGPFTLNPEEWDEGTSLILRKNNNYWRKDNNFKQLPYLDVVQISFIADKTQEYLTFLQGKFDFIAGIDGNTIEHILNKDGSVKASILERFKVQKMPYLNTEYIGFQLNSLKYENKNHPLLNVKVRKALSYAINRKELVSFLRNNLGIAGTEGFVPFALPAHNKGSVKGYHFDEKKAKALLAEAGYPEGKNFPKITLYTNPVYSLMIEYLQRQWKKVLNVDVDIALNTFIKHQELIDNGQVKLFRGAWLGDYPDEENYLTCFYSENFSPHGPNKTHYNNPEFDKLYQAVQHEQNSWKRFELFHQMEQLVLDDCAVIVLFYDEVLRIMNKKVVGLTPNSMNYLKLERVDFEKILQEIQ
ncbi:MAG: peptide ABC transporter substrate-binding protein [Bacteroidota bacterium]